MSGIGSRALALQDYGGHHEAEDARIDAILAEAWRRSRLTPEEEHKELSKRLNSWRISNSSDLIDHTSAPRN
jgi:hypothetical protein